MKPPSKLKKVKLPTRKSLEKKIWEICKQITRKKHGHNCYTCPKANLAPKDCHTGHGKPKGALPLKFKYDLRNLRPQCYHDNINLGGATDIFLAKLEREKEGLQFLKEACVKIEGRWEIKRGDLMGSTEAIFFLMNLLEDYKQKLADLS